MTYNKMQDPLIGQQLDEYRLDELLGRGGMARVYTATDIHLGRKVAIKVIDAPYRADVEYGNRFRREARAIAQLEHPHVVRLYRYGEVDELFYIAMQYVEGSDLADLIHEAKQKGALLPLEQVRNVIAQVCQALDYVHSKGVIHRDIKPSNILINQEGQRHPDRFWAGHADHHPNPRASFRLTPLHCPRTSHLLRQRRAPKRFIRRGRYAL